MPKKSRKSHRRGRRYSDCAPTSPRRAASSRAKRFGSIGPVAAGFDHYGYPIIRNFHLPAPFRLAEGRNYGAAQSAIKPMRLVAAQADGSFPLPKPGIAKVDKYKLKPSPSVPAAPRDLPPQFKFCVQKGEQGYFFRFRNGNTSLHGAEANVVDCQPDDAGMMLCMVNMPGTSHLVSAPLCEEPGADKEPVSPDCCVKLLGDKSGQLVCPGSSYDLLITKIVTFANVNGIQIASVEHPDLPGGGLRLPVCEPMDEEPDERPCCIEEETGLIVCPKGVDFPLAGNKIPIQYLEFADNVDGMKVARLRCGDISDLPPSERAANPTLDAMFNVCESLGGYIFPVCTRKPPTRIPVPKRPRKTPPQNIVPTPPKWPDICCYDPTTGTLVCEGTRYHGLAVNVVTETVVNGKPIVSVENPNLPGGGARLPLCPPTPEIPRLPPADCCVVESSAGLTLMCDPTDHPWNERNVTSSGKCIDLPNGVRMCVLRWEDQYGEHTLEVPVCPPPPERIPPPEADVPPAPQPIPIPVPDSPRLPPASHPPTDGRESEEASRCRENWDAMVKRPAKLTKCDKRWLEVLRKIQEGKAAPSPGRRASSLNLNGKRAGAKRAQKVAGKKAGTPRKYGMGIGPEHREYARFPGLRGGRRTI